MKVKIFLLNKNTHKVVEFPDCDTLEDVRKWLNQAAPFITVSKDEIINTNQIRKIKPLDSIKQEARK